MKVYVVRDILEIAGDGIPRYWHEGGIKTFMSSDAAVSFIIGVVNRLKNGEDIANLGFFSVPMIYSEDDIKHIVDPSNFKAHYAKGMRIFYYFEDILCVDVYAEYGFKIEELEVEE